MFSRSRMKLIALTLVLASPIGGFGITDKQATAATIAPTTLQTIDHSTIAQANKQYECQQIANVFSMGNGFQNTGNLNSSQNLIDNLLVGMQGLSLSDPKLRSLQTRYIQYFSAASQTLTAGSQSANDDAQLERLITLAQVNSSLGSSLGQELVEYCLQ